MGWLDGWLTGFADRHRQIEQENLALAQKASEREGRVFEALLNSRDPEVRGMAATGLIAGTQPLKRKSGLSGWIGEMQSNPMYPKLMNYINTPQLQGYEDIPGTGIDMTAKQAGYVPREPSTAAMSPTQTTAPGAAGPAPVQPGPPPPPVAKTMGEIPPADLQGMLGDLEKQGIYNPDLKDPAVQDFLLQQHRQRGLDAQALVSGVERPRGVGGPTPASLGELQVKAQLGPGTEPAALHVAPQQRAVYGLPSVFPTAEDTQIAAAGAKVTGEIEALARVYMATDPSLSHADAMKRAAAQYEAERRKAISPFKTYPVQYTGADGNIVQTMGTYDNTAGTWRDAQMRPIVGNVTRIQPENLGTWGTMALANLGYRNMAEVPMDQRDDVVAEAMRLRTVAAYNTGTGAGLAKFDTPADLAKAQAAGVPVGTTSRSLAGQPVPTIAQNDRRKMLGVITNQLHTIESKLGVLPSGSELGGYAPGWVMNWRRMQPQWKPAIGALESSVNQILASLSRTVQENKGAQTEQDALRAMDTLAHMKSAWSDPQGTDTREQAQARLAETIAFLEQEMAKVPPAPTPTDVSPPPAPPTAKPPGSADVATPPPGTNAGSTNLAGPDYQMVGGVLYY